MKKTIMALALVAAMAFQAPVYAQGTTTDATTTTTTSRADDDDDDDDNGNWGLAGLLGLLGLLGLRRKDDDRRHVTTVRRD
jgi:MYXO-CTERM domain-containing protein